MDLNAFLEQNNKLAVAYSGGVDSVYLLHAAVSAGADVRAYLVRSQFQPGSELDDALAMARLILGDAPVDDGSRLRIIELDALADERVRSNPPDRCYYCKLRIMGAIREAAAADGYDLLCDGTNASDDAGNRPGMRALRELGVRSPLRECGIEKPEIRRRLKEAGIPVWDKPAYACLATRVKTGTQLTGFRLSRTEKAEKYLYDLGFRDHRVRTLPGPLEGRCPDSDTAVVQVTAAQMPDVLRHEQEIKRELSSMYGKVEIDSRTR